jgi:Peptidase M15
MSEPWRDINDPAPFFKPEPEPPDKTRVVATDNYEKQEKKEPEISATLKNARFLPDENTDFTKSCKIKTDIESEKTGQVTFSLWARYKGREYDLQHQVKADSSSKQSTAEVKLFYVDEHYHDINAGDKNASVDYFAKISMKGAKPITSEILTLPVQKSNDGLEIRTIDLPNESISFTTADQENEIHCVAVITASEIPEEQEEHIEWEIQSDPISPYKAPIPDISDAKGNDVRIKIIISKEENGRQWNALKYQIRAKLLYNGNVFTSKWEKFGQDEKDFLRQQYVDMSKNRIPERSEFINSGKSQYFSLAEGACTCGHHTWHVWSIMSNLDDVREALGQPMIVNSGFRCPQKNVATPGSAPESQHQYGVAADIAVGDYNGNGKSDKDDWNHLVEIAKQQGAKYTEDYEHAGSWVHMDWR